MQQIAQRRPATYGKKSTSGRLAEGINSLVDKSSSNRSSRLQRPSQSPAKYRKLNSLLARDPNVFDVPSSDDESTIEARHRTSPSQTESSTPQYPQGISDFHEKPDTLETPVVTLWPGRQRQAVATSQTGARSILPQTPTTELALSSKGLLDSRMKTCELDRGNSEGETDNEARKVSTTPRQSRLWTELLQEESGSEERIHELEILGSEKNAQPSMKNHLPSRNRRRKTTKLVEKLRPSEDRESLIPDSVFGGPTTFQTYEDLDNLGEHSFQTVSAGHSGSYSTYSQERTCLQDDLDYDQLLLQSKDETSSITKNGDAHMTGGWNFEINSGDEDIGSGVRSIHELRAAGDAVRFDNEVNDILEGINADGQHALSSQRSGLIVLAMRLQSSTFRQRFIEGSYQHMLFKTIMCNEDVICATASAAALLFLLHDEASTANTSVHSLAEISVGQLSSALANDNTLIDIAKDAQLNLSRFAQNSLIDFHQLLQNSNLFATKNTFGITPRDVSLRSLEILMRRAREAGCGVNLLTSKLLRQLIDLGRAWMTETSEKSSYDLETVLSVLEKSTVATSGHQGESLWIPQDVQDVTLLLEAAIKLESAQKTSRQLALKLCLNLSNNCEPNADALNSRGLIRALLDIICKGLKAGQPADSIVKLGKADGKAIEQLDDLILSLGAMMNLAEMSGMVRQAIEQDHRIAFDSIVQLFIENRREYHGSISISGASLQIAFGYVAILLANLAQNSRLRARITTLLPNGRIQSLIEVVEEFLGQHLEADRQSQDGQDWVAFTQRLQAVVDSLKDVVHARKMMYI